MFKKITVAVALTGLMAGMAYAGTAPKTGINGSMHDMNIYNASPDALGRTCVFCHTPHNAVTVNTAPLWNRADIAAAPAAYVWKMPTNSPFTIGTDPTVGPTRLCLSCHDGSVAPDSHLTNNTKAGSKSMVAGDSAYIKDLGKTHPVGFSYNDAVANTGRGTAELMPVGTGFITAATADLAAFNTNARGTLATSATKTIASVLFGTTGVMTCASCHEVHNTTNASPDTAGAYNYFLHAKEENSAICLSCHVK